MTPPRVAVIVGAGSGFGRQLALGLSRAGFVIAANDRTPTQLDETIRQIEAAGGTARAYIAETGKGLPARAMIDDVLDDWDRIDVLVNCLMIFPPAAFLDLDEWDWQHALEVNLNGPFLLMQAVGRVMREQGGGVIANIIRQPEGPAGGQPVWEVAQAARQALSASTAKEFLAYNIHVRALCSPAQGNPQTVINEIVQLASSLT